MASRDPTEPPDENAHSVRRRPPGADAFNAATRPFTRTGGYYAASWRDYLGRKPGSLPIARPTITPAAQAFRDKIALLGLRARRPISDLRAFERIDAEVVAALELHGRKGWLDRPERFFAQPPKLTDVAVRPAKALGHRFERLSFASGHRPHTDEPTNWASTSSCPCCRCTAHAVAGYRRVRCYRAKT